MTKISDHLRIAPRRPLRHIRRMRHRPDPVITPSKVRTRRPYGHSSFRLIPVDVETPEPGRITLASIVMKFNVQCKTCFREIELHTGGKAQMGRTLRESDWTCQIRGGRRCWVCPACSGVK